MLSGKLTMLHCALQSDGKTPVKNWIIICPYHLCKTHNFFTSVDFSLIENMNSSSSVHQITICEIIGKGKRNQTVIRQSCVSHFTPPLTFKFQKIFVCGFLEASKWKREALITVIAITNHDLSMFERGKVMLPSIQYFSALNQIRTWFWIVGKMEM